MADSTIKPLLPVNKTGSVLKRVKKPARSDSDVAPEEEKLADDDSPADSSSDAEQPDNKPDRHIDTYA